MEKIKAVVIIILAILSTWGIINFPELVLKTGEQIKYELDDPNKMILQISGVEPNKEHFLIFYSGYTITAVLVNTGSSGFVTIGCDAYNNVGKTVAHKETTFHIERNSQKDLSFQFDPNELSEDELYSFNVTVISHNIDS